MRQLYDCPDVAVGPEGVRCRVVVATHRATEKKSRIGHTHNGVVYELFFTQLPQDAFTASDVVALAPPIVGPLNQSLPMKTRSKTPTDGVLMRPLDKKRGRLSHNGSGTCAWNSRHMLEPTPMRTTEFAPPVKETTEEQGPVQGYGKPSVALPWKAGRFSGQDFALQPDGLLHCPDGKTLRVRSQLDSTIGDN